MTDPPTTRRWRPHWAWAPAAILSLVIAWHRYGPLITIGLGAVGLGLGIWLERRARRRASDTIAATANKDRL